MSADSSPDARALPSDGFDAGVMVVEHSHRSGRSLLTIARVTPTLVIVERKNMAGEVYETRFRRKNGHRVGANTWHGSHITVATREEIDAIREDRRRHKMIERIRATTLENLSTTQLRSICDTLELAGLANG